MVGQVRGPGEDRARGAAGLWAARIVRGGPGVWRNIHQGFRLEDVGGRYCVVVRRVCIPVRVQVRPARAGALLRRVRPD